MRIDLATATTMEIKAAKGHYPIAAEYWLVATWYAPDRRWKLWTDRWDDENCATMHAEILCDGVRGHTHYTLIHVELPGAKI